MSPLHHTALLTALVVVLMGYILWLGRQGGPEGSGRVPPDREATRRHLYWGLFYLNPEDPRGWLPKLSGLGWTVNFRARKHVHAFVVLLLAILAEAVLLTWSALSAV